MGYPIYKLIRAVNRQYPNNGFINYVDVREDMYDQMEGQLIDEDLRDLINETLQEVYKDVALDEVYSFPTVAGQNQYVLPEDCDLRDIQEVTRTFQGWRGPLCPPPGPPPLEPVYAMYFDAGVDDIRGTGSMDPLECNIGDRITFPECTFTPPAGYRFKAWKVDGDDTEYQPGDTYEMQTDIIAMAVWEQTTFTLTLRNKTNDDRYIVIAAKKTGEAETTTDLYYDQLTAFETEVGGNWGYDYITVYFLGVPFLNFDVTTPMTRDVMRDIAHPSVVPDGEHTGDNWDGHTYDNNPLENLPVTPIDNGDGGYNGNPLDDPNYVEPEPSENPIRDDVDPAPIWEDPNTPDPQLDDPDLPPFDDDEGGDNGNPLNDQDNEDDNNDGGYGDNPL